MPSFKPELVFFRENALDYTAGEQLFEKLKKEKISVKIISSRGPLPIDYDLPFKKQFHRAKKIILVSVRSVNKFQSCKPSAHFQLPLVSGCPGNCHYCYLSTNLGKNPYIKIYANIEEILNRAEKYIEEASPEITIFEGAATSDPLPVEKWSGSLARTINFFAGQKYGRFRFVSKFDRVDTLLSCKHSGHTEIRFSLNTDHIIKKFESNTPGLEERLQAAKKIKEANYPLGFLIAPIFIYQNWQQDYLLLLKKLNKLFPEGKGISLELITHRFTDRAEKIIDQVYPGHQLPHARDKRKFKYGQFGYGKYVYPADKMNQIKTFMLDKIQLLLPEADYKYLV